VGLPLSLSEETMKTVLGDSWERIWRMCPPDPAPAVIVGKPGHQVRPATNVTRFTRLQAQQNANPRASAGPSAPARSTVPAKRKAQVEVVDLT